MLSWAHTGFGAFIGHEIPAKDRQGREEVVRYLVHPPVVVGRILGDASGGSVVYMGGKVHARHKANFRTFDPLAFVAEVVSHIPNVHEKTAIWYGWYSNKSRGTRKAKGQETSTAPADLSPEASAKGEGSTSEGDRAPTEVRKDWARLIRKVYEVDPLECPRCHAPMRVIALIDRPDVIERILTHLKLSGGEEPGRPPPPLSSEPHVEPLIDGLPYEEPASDEWPTDDEAMSGWVQSGSGWAHAHAHARQYWEGFLGAVFAFWLLYRVMMKACCRRAFFFLTALLTVPVTAVVLHHQWPAIVELLQTTPKS